MWNGGLRKGIDGLFVIIGDKYHQNSFEKESLFLLCADTSIESRDGFG